MRHCLPRLGCIAALAVASSCSPSSALDSPSAAESITGSTLIHMKPTGGTGHTGAGSVGCGSSAYWTCVTDGITFAANDGDKTYVYSTANAAEQGLVYTGAPNGAVTQVKTHTIAAAESGGSGTVTVSLYSSGKLLATGTPHSLTGTYTDYQDDFAVSVASANSLQTHVVFSTAKLKFTEIWLDVTLNGLSGDAGGSHSVALQWVASTTPNVTYDVLRGAAHGGPYTPIQTGITTTSTTDSTVSSATTYYYVARAQDSAGQSSDSNEVVAVIP
jgi:hypothetical protein